MQMTLMMTKRSDKQMRERFKRNVGYNADQRRRRHLQILVGVIFFVASGASEQQDSLTSVFVAASGATSDGTARQSYPVECFRKCQAPSSFSSPNRCPGALPRYLPHRREKQETEDKYILLKSHVACVEDSAIKLSTEGVLRGTEM